MDYLIVGDIMREELEQYGVQVNEGKGFGYQVIRLIYKDSPVQIDLWPFEASDLDTRDDSAKKQLSDKIMKFHNTFFAKFSLKDLQSGAIPFPRIEFAKLEESMLPISEDSSKAKTIFSTPEALPYGKPFIHDYRNIFPLKKIEFENTEFFAPLKPQLFISNLYGQNWMDFPNFKVNGHCNINNKLTQFNAEKILAELTNISREKL